MDNSNSNILPIAMTLGGMGILGILYYYTIQPVEFDLAQYCSNTEKNITNKLTAQNRKNCLDEYFTILEERKKLKQTRLDTMLSKQDECPITNIFFEHKLKDLYQDYCNQETTKRNKLFEQIKKLDFAIQSAEKINNVLENVCGNRSKIGKNYQARYE